MATARRDLEALSTARVPVYPQPGRGGEWSLVGGARTDLSGLTAYEAPGGRTLPAGQVGPVQARAGAAPDVPVRRGGRGRRGRGRPGTVGERGRARPAVVEVLQERTLRVDRVLAAVVTERPADLNLSQV